MDNQVILTQKRLNPKYAHILLQKAKRTVSDHVPSRIYSFAFGPSSVGSSKSLISPAASLSQKLILSLPRPFETMLNWMLYINHVSCHTFNQTNDGGVHTYSH